MGRRAARHGEGWAPHWAGADKQGPGGQTLLRGGHDPSEAGSHEARAVAVAVMLCSLPLAIYALQRLRAAAAAAAAGRVGRYERFLSERAAAARWAAARGLPPAVALQVSAAYDYAWEVHRCTAAAEAAAEADLPEAFRLACFRCAPRQGARGSLTRNR